MNGKIDPSLNTDERGCYEASLVIPDDSGIKYQPCVITGNFGMILKMTQKNEYLLKALFFFLFNRLSSFGSQNGF